MKAQLFIFITLFCLSLNAQAQRHSFDFGTPTKNELTMTSLENTDTEALVIYEIGKTSFEIDPAKFYFYLKITNRTKIKILNKDGLKYADIEIPYYSSGINSEEVTEIKGATYHLVNDSIIKKTITSGIISDKKINSNWQAKTFTMPDAKVGSVIEWEYTIISPFFFNIREWQFQKYIPVVLSKFEFETVPFYEYESTIKGIRQLDVNESTVITMDHQLDGTVYRKTLQTMIMRQVPAFEDIEFITSPKDYMSSVLFQLSRVNHPHGGGRNIVTTWPTLCDEILEEVNFGKYISAAEKESKDFLASLSLKEKTGEEQIKAITTHVKNYFTWNKYNAKFAERKVADVIKSGSGSSAEINLLLLGALRSQGIEAKPILMSTRGNGIIDTSHPFQQLLNYVIVQANCNGKLYYLDATEPLLPFDKLPTRCINVKGLVVEKSSDQWIDIPQDSRAMKEYTFNLRPNDDLSALEVDARYDAYDYDAYLYRHEYSNNDYYLINYFRKQEVDIKGEIKVENLYDLEKPFTYSLQMSLPLQKRGEQIQISPLVGHAPVENMFTQDERTLPIDLLFRNVYQFNSTFEIPAGYKVETLPEDAHIDTRCMKASYKTEVNGNVITTSAHYEFKNNVFPAEDYEILKESYNEIIKTLNRKIILQQN